MGARNIHSVFNELLGNVLESHMQHKALDIHIAARKARMQHKYLFKSIGDMTIS